MTVNARGHEYGVSALLLLVAIVIFALGIFGVHLGSVTGEKWTDLGLAVFAASFLVP